MKNGGDRKSEEIRIRDRTVLTREEAAKMVGTRPQAISEARLIRDLAPG
jgi:DNA-binding XRE family transcriptional regulator